MRSATCSSGRAPHGEGSTVEGTSVRSSHVWVNALVEGVAPVTLLVFATFKKNKNERRGYQLKAVFVFVCIDVLPDRSSSMFCTLMDGIPAEKYND